MKLRSFFRFAWVWLLAITGAHLWLNFDWSGLINEYLPVDQRKLNVAFIPVT